MLHYVIIILSYLQHEKGKKEMQKLFIVNST